jgi:excisionase family DNA binding protein
MAEKAAFDVPEVAQAIGCNEKTVRKGISDGQIPSFRVGRLVRVPAWWVKQKKKGPEQPATAA